MPAWVTDFTGLAALISSVAAVISAMKAGAAAKELRPDSGNSTKDLISTIDSKVNSIGKQVGEIRSDAVVWHSDLASRIRTLERRSRQDYEE